MKLSIGRVLRHHLNHCGAYAPDIAGGRGRADPQWCTVYELNAKGLDRFRSHPVGRAHHSTLGTLDLAQLRGHTKVC